MTNPSRRTALRHVIVPLAAAALLPVARAQATWPAKPIKLVVPFPPGGGTDLAARIISESLAARLGQPVVIDNKPGASTAIGVATVSSAEADGYTLLFSGSSSYTVNPAVRRKLSYDPFKQLTPLALVVRAPLVLVTSAAGPYKTIKDVLAKAAADPKTVTYTTFGSGSAPHLAGELLAFASNSKLSPVPYKGSAESTIGVARGDVDIGIDTIAAVNPLVQSGKLRVLAIISEKRSALLPTVSSYGELNLSAALLEAWYAVAGPANMPAPLREQILRALTAVMAQPDVKRKLALQFMEPALLGEQGLKAMMDSEITRYRALVARAGISMD